MQKSGKQAKDDASAKHLVSKLHFVVLIFSTSRLALIHVHFVFT